MIDLSTIPFRQAAHYRPAGRKTVDLIVMHTAEIGRSQQGAANLMIACATTPDVKSWHFAVDAGAVTQSVLERDIAFHAPGANMNGIGIELCAQASYTAEQWADDYSTALLANAAQLVAMLCRRWGIPVSFVDAEGLVAPSARGITTHKSVTDAFQKGDHTDPGPNWPRDAFIAQVAALSTPAPF